MAVILDDDAPSEREFFDREGGDRPVLAGPDGTIAGEVRAAERGLR